MTDGTSARNAIPARPILWRLLFPERHRLALALAITLLAALAELPPYALLSQSIGLALTGTASGGDLLGLAGWMGAALLIKFLLYSLAYYLSHVAAYRLLADIRQTLVRRLAVAPLIWLQRHSSGDLKKIVLQDVERLEQFIAHHTVECLAALASPVFVALVLAWIDWRLAAAALLTLPLAATLQALLMRGLGPRIEDYGRTIGALNGATVEYIRNAPVMKAFCQNARSFEHMRDLLARYHAMITAMTRKTVPGWSAFMVLLGANIVFLLPFGLWLHRQHALELTEVILAVMLGSGMLKPLFKVAHFSSEIGEILAGVRRLAPLLAFQPTAPAAVAPAPAAAADSAFADAITFDRVSFSYGARTILQDVSFTLKAGGFTALVGPSGAGKSTIAHLMGGLVLADRGDIRVGAVSLSSLSEAGRAGLIGVASQDSFLFAGTLMDNLRLGRPEAGADMVRHAARIAQAEDFIAALPEGYATTLGERGTRLSGGERQRIALARALISQTPVLVLDEATAFADGRTERRFYQALRAAYPDQTLLVIAHRLTAIAQADQILVLEDGRVIDGGRHADLLERCPLYQTLWRRQFDSETWSIRPKGTADAAHS
ncbi:ABC transporter ATP-binding protein [Rhodospirillum rubrum]|uniref:ABC transporter, transmembrane region n=1 Tax=Rhodospirillum rubrum (strain ATCC 11170 / ATH 1.1.1 / DSM 467 / LMG 4362 / NCIMB 8255 / S1) TaxID=269796 RepID=Q2RW30_RHORT|nr:ABC transporter ATP-binding protein [Rhodospirillum rubrum]ABC21665.1 ABC transporter, transmembrane region [Rhodospirillum rubrum ATCC 11170]AEO47363.1 ABC transporter transmembrane region [Rhodospirillum rubrum F11]MBK5953216.1 ABC transporter ATP-binding protein [Rhodospirillum rubrum]QXG81331.1 ABC transporter ATP-binding protein/permease [Rhodospirillum rubrum]HAQ00409.1 ABC transporter ATP-binding protein [Rhodospirillum rubrum]